MQQPRMLRITIIACEGGVRSERHTQAECPAPHGGRALQRPMRMRHTHSAVHRRGCTQQPGAPRQMPRPCKRGQYDAEMRLVSAEHVPSCTPDRRRARARGAPPSTGSHAGAPALREQRVRTDRIQQAGAGRGSQGARVQRQHTGEGHEEWRSFAPPLSTTQPWTQAPRRSRATFPAWLRSRARTGRRFLPSRWILCGMRRRCACTRRPSISCRPCVPCTRRTKRSCGAWSRQQVRGRDLCSGERGAAPGARGAARGGARSLCARALEQQWPYVEQAMIEAHKVRSASHAALYAACPVDATAHGRQRGARGE